MQCSALVIEDGKVEDILCLFCSFLEYLFVYFGLLCSSGPQLDIIMHEPGVMHILLQVYFCLQPLLASLYVFSVVYFLYHFFFGTYIYNGHIQ